jgi:hypothetical protein
MLKAIRFHTILIVSGALMALSAFADEMDTDMDMGTTEIPVVDEARDLLIDTAARDDAADLAASETTRDLAQMELDQAIAAGATPEEINALTLERDAAQGEVDMENGEAEAVAAAVAAMSDEQVEDANRALHNTWANGTIVDLDAATLEDIFNRDLNHREIQALTKALEEDAKFQHLAARFEGKYEESGRAQFLRHRDRAIDRGEQQRAKFEGKVDRFVEARTEMQSELRAETRGEAKRSARDNAKGEAKRAAREEARHDGRSNGRGRN